MAAQTIADESYVKKDGLTAADLKKSDVHTLSEVTLGKDDAIVVLKSDGKIAYVEHTATNGKTCWYKGSEYVTTTDPGKPTGDDYIEFGA